MRKILVNFDLEEEYLEKLRRNCGGCPIVFSRDRGSMAEELKDTEILITFRRRIPSEMIDDARNLRWVQVLTAGVDSLPLETLRERGIIVTSGTGIHRIFMAEYAIASMINLARNFHLVFRNQMQRKWDRTPPQGEIYGSTLGILGLGSIGREVARRASRFGMRVIGVKRTPEPVEYVERVYGFRKMKEIFRQSDYVINLLPDTAETRGVVDKGCFDLMKSSACFINMGRGATVREADLIDALRKRTIRALVSDVFAVEPLPEDSPLWTLDNVILTPHICGVSDKYLERGMDIVLHNLEVYLTGSGTMVNVVDYARGY